MADTPYCPLLSINKEFPVMCQEELCMWYVKQLKLCSLTVMAYTNALNIQGPGASPQSAKQQSQPLKQPLTEPIKEKPKPQSTTMNPFVLDDLD